MPQFCTPAWVEAYGQAINESTAYKMAAKSWTHGAMALVVEADPDLGLDEPFGMRLDLHEGRCREARACGEDDLSEVPFVLRATHARWKDILAGRLDPIAGMVTRKLQVKGPLTTLMRYVTAAKELVRAAGGVETTFLDE